MPTLYQIHSPRFVETIEVSSYKVLRARGPLSWATGKQWEDVREYFDRRGYTVIPLLELESNEHPSSLVHNGYEYTFQWEGDTLVRCSKHLLNGQVLDVSYFDLPYVLRKLL